MISRSRNPTARKGSGSFFVIPLLLLSLANLLPAARADENTAASSDEASQAVLKEVSRLRALKAQNPERYQAWLAQKKEQVAGQINTLRQQSPGQYNRFKNQRRAYRNASADFLKKQHPDEMKRWAGRHMTRFNELRQKNPAKFERVMQHHPRLKEHFKTRSAQSVRPVADRPGRPDFRRQNSQHRINKRPTGTRTGMRPGPGQRGPQSAMTRPNQGNRDRRGGQAARPRDRR